MNNCPLDSLVHKRFVGRLCLQVLLLLASIASSHADPKSNITTAFTYLNFHEAKGLNFQGAARAHQDVLRLTQSAPSENGLVFYGEKLPLARGFETSFTFRITQGSGPPDPTDGSGGDGFALVLQNAGASPTPSLIGYIPYHIPGVLAVEFDTWMNGNLGDPDGNHISVQRVPSRLNARKPFVPFEHDQSAGWGTPPVNLADGKTHEVRVVYRPGLLQVFFDTMKEPAVIAETDLAGATDAQGMGYLGFAAGTGAAYQGHEILSWSFKAGDGKK